MPEPTGKTCILLSTFSKYLPIARITHELLSRYWSDHPPLFIAGVEHFGSENATCLPVRSDIKEWTTILADACDVLLSSGFSDAYLILDDHPPLNGCHVEHLNTTIPRLRESLDATYIGLNGWGYGRPGRRINGRILSSNGWKLENMDSSFTWKASLHPGLWSVARLGRLCRMIQDVYPPNRRTAWAFERVVGGNRLPAGFDYAGSFYRVCGRCMTDQWSRYLRYRSAYTGVSLLYAVLRKLGIEGVYLKRIVDALGFYYEGPYPLFWSGLVSQGRVNPSFLKYAELYRRTDLYPIIRHRVPHWMIEPD